MRYFVQFGFTLVRFACAVVFLTVLTAPMLGREPLDRGGRTPPDAAGPFMRAKLASSQKILEGLATKKFGLIQDGAKELGKMSDAAGWKRSNDAVYLHYSREFRRLTEKIERLAEDRNVEGASFTYMHMVSTCLSCHEHSRDVLRIADFHTQQKGPVRRLGDIPIEDNDPPGKYRR